ncbi:MAG: glycerophosphoryl diester phosphodiesterase [Frankiaceae bacterium]|nr:glycerophosphoryl diester phosphodiesterase [Frankiaceae bacterium]
MQVYGHRGSAATHPENSVAGVVAAFAAGADGVEVDVRRTADGLLVLCHDPAFAGSDEPIVALTAATLPAHAAVADVLDAARGRVVLEVKNMPGEPDFDAPAEATARLLAVLLAGRSGDDVVVSSFDWYAAEVARDAGLRSAFLTPPGIALSAALAYVSDAGHAECHPHWTAVLDEPEAVSAAHDAGRAVVCWTVDDVEVARRLRDVGVDGVITNDPAAMVVELRSV